MAEQITRAQIMRLSELARIELTEDEMTSLEHDLGSILSYVSELSSHSAVEGIERNFNGNTLRADEYPDEGGVHSKALLSEAPRTRGEHFSVKQIITQRDDH